MSGVRYVKAPAVGEHFMLEVFAEAGNLAVTRLVHARGRGVADPEDGWRVTAMPVGLRVPVVFRTLEAAVGALEALRGEEVPRFKTVKAAARWAIGEEGRAFRCASRGVAARWASRWGEHTIADLGPVRCKREGCEKAPEKLVDGVDRVCVEHVMWAIYGIEGDEEPDMVEGPVAEGE